MKIDKRKVVFGSVLLCIVMFIISYYLMTFGKNSNNNEKILSQPEVPKLENPSKKYESRLHAVNDLQEKKTSEAPSLYQEHLSESVGYSEEEQEKPGPAQTDRLGWTMESWSFNHEDQPGPLTTGSEIIPGSPVEKEDAARGDALSSEELRLAQELFFSQTKVLRNKGQGITDSVIVVTTEDQQVVRANSRLRMRLKRAAWIDGCYYPGLTPIYGFVSFAPNRVLLSIENVMHHPIALNAYDMQDGGEGIYVENNFRAEASREILDDAIDEINIPSLPQVEGLGKLFKKNNRNVKVTVTNGYTLLLKPKQ